MIHAIQYDYYGKRIITCSSDGKAKIWCRNPAALESTHPTGTQSSLSSSSFLASSSSSSSSANLTTTTVGSNPNATTIGIASSPSSPSTPDEWICQATIIPNLGTLWQSTWAHPEFGQIIALAGEHTIVTIWEEQETVDHYGNIVSRWNKRAELGDARNSVYDIQFAPRHSGLRLATASGDGYVRIYEVTDVMNLTHWPLIDELYDNSYDNIANNAAAMNSASTNHATPTTTSEVSYTSALAYRTNSQAVTCLSWCTSQFDTPMLVIGNSYGKLRIWGYASTARKWVPMLDLSVTPSTDSSILPYLSSNHRILDVAWAPNIGRSYHYISASTVDGFVYLWKIVPDNPTDKEWNRVSLPTLPDGGTNNSNEGNDNTTKVPFASWKTSFYNSLPNYNHHPSPSTATVGLATAYPTLSNNSKLPGNIYRHPYATVNAVLTEIFPALSATIPSKSLGSSAVSGTLLGGTSNKGVTNKSIWRTVWNVSGTVLVTVEDNGIIVFRRQQFPNSVWSIIGMINENGEELLYTGSGSSNGLMNHPQAPSSSSNTNDASFLYPTNHYPVYPSRHQNLPPPATTTTPASPLMMGYPLQPYRTPPSSSLPIQHTKGSSSLANAINSPMLLPATAFTK